MKKLLVIAQTVIADAVRRKVVWVVVVFGALLAIAVPALPNYGLGVVAAVYREISIALMWAAALVVALALSATRVPVEVERRTVFNVLSRDVRRWQYVAGTWLGIFAVLGMALLAFTVITIGIGAFQFDEWMWRLFEAAFAVWLEMGVVLAFAVMMSTSVGVVTSIVASLAFVFVGHSLGGLLGFSGESAAPWWLPTLSVFNVINPVAHGTGYGLAYGASMTLAFVAWIALLLLGGSALFSRRDL
jgi:ABC-type transport system involved in multi-copper enzyme maturation permease subunit